MAIILGIDPGSRVTGYGVIESDKSQFTYIDSGCIKLTHSSFAERLKKIFDELQIILNQYNPTDVAIEQIFFHINPNSVLKLAQARGAAIVAAVKFGLSIDEYSARQIKQAVVGYGAATKQQVQYMVRMLLKLNKYPQVDAADALAIATCHGQSKLLQTLVLTQKSKLQQRFRQGRLR